MANTHEMSEWGVDKVLERLHEDLVKLYNGVKIQTETNERKIYGLVVSICGDTLAPHELCGFKEGVGLLIENVDNVNSHSKKCQG